MHLLAISWNSMKLTVSMKERSSWTFNSRGKRSAEYLALAGLSKTAPSTSTRNGWLNIPIGCSRRWGANTISNIDFRDTVTVDHVDNTKSPLRMGKMDIVLIFDATNVK